ncbi:MAG TPA: SOS response-associated peptidase [Kofleriaceae bacterium]|jgi:putative SOS response-associated peptidase YedK|nr:SOS response-associated peptidase [Kofleriaceae bacterium]
MCGRYTITRQDSLVEDLEKAMGQLHLDPGVATNVWWKPRFNVAPTQDAPVVALRDGVRTLEMMRWGLVPFWAAKAGAAKPPLMINARVEGIETKRVFRDALERKRCLVPADGFFEWKRQGKGKTATKTPMFIHPRDRGIFMFAGLWARAKLPAGELHSFTIITGPPNELVAPIHDRMPIVLARDAWDAWLDPALPLDGAHALLGVPPVANWTAEPVSNRVNVAVNDDPSLIEPAETVENAAPAQRSLFD